MLAEGGADGIGPLDALSFRDCVGHHIRPNGNEKAMLIEFIDLVEPEQGSPLPDPNIVRSVVRLDTIDGFYCSISHASYLSHLSGAVLAGRLKDRKVDVSFLCLGSDGTDLYQVPGKMIQGATQVLSDVPDQRREMRGYLFEDPKIVRALTTIKIVLMERLVGVAIQREAEDLGIEINDVLIGPIDFD